MTKEKKKPELELGRLKDRQEQASWNFVNI